MKKGIKSILAIVLVFSILLTSNISAIAASNEVYLSDLRLIYASTYKEAKEILSDTEFKNYSVLNENLNENTKEIGVWLAYETTTNIEEAITDLTVMQMQGGFEMGNYQEMLKKSYDEYLKMGATYLQAIDYFMEAYYAGDYFADVAYRQLNFYTVETVGETTQKKHDFEGELLGDIFSEGIAVEDLATLFMQGNTYALQNIRSLLGMGVSYNEDGMTYMEKVIEAAAEMRDDPTVFDDENYSELLPNISMALISLRDQFKELEAAEKDIDWEDEVFTEEEIKFAEIAFIATLMRDAEYLNGKTLYQFCMDHKENESDSVDLYPLAAALNDGQAALTKVFHYYDVLRYSISDMSQDVIEEQLAEMEEIYSEEPFNVYAGVDRSIFDGSFALTTDAYRANTMNEYSLEEILFGDAASLHTKFSNGTGAVGLGIMVFAICRTIYYKSYMVGAADKAGYEAGVAMNSALKNIETNVDKFAAQTVPNVGKSYDSFADELMRAYVDDVSPSSCTFAEKVALLEQADDVIPEDASVIQDMANALKDIDKDAWAYDFDDHFSYSKVLYGGGTTLTAILYILGGAMMLYSAITLAVNAYNYYHPDYDDIPLSMVDLVDTVDGDRFIKYDVVFEVEANDKGEYNAGDLNAFEAKRWIALYYTKSYEAGKPLLADEFVVSNSNNTPRSGYAPVRRFGEVVCYNLNKYNYKEDTNIFMSVKQSKSDKAAVANVPQVVGSIFANGLWLVASGIGAIVGVSGTLATQSLLKKKRSAQNKED